MRDADLSQFTGPELRTHSAKYMHGAETVQHDPDGVIEPSETGRGFSGPGMLVAITIQRHHLTSALTNTGGNA